MKDGTPRAQPCAHDLVILHELEQILAPMYETSNEDDASETRPQSTEEMKIQQEWDAMMNAKDENDRWIRKMNTREGYER